MPSTKYKTARAFRKALEERLKRISLADQVDLSHLRCRVSFDRLLARLFREPQASWALKGGHALELRFKAARSTVDIDLTVRRVTNVGGSDTNEVVRDMLLSAAKRSFGRFVRICDRIACYGFDGSAVWRRTLPNRGPNG
ncbi:MAG TPA: nucleotidyl transferase AbiEii/AbiGii toxin family protein [Terriglobales bacterium]|jgi:hypothetical protein